MLKKPEYVHSKEYFTLRVIARTFHVTRVIFYNVTSLETDNREMEHFPGWCIHFENTDKLKSYTTMVPMLYLSNIGTVPTLSHFHKTSSMVPI